MATKIVRSDGVQVWHNEEGQLHNDNGPAVIYPNGTKYWYREGDLHNNNGPAVIYPNGTKKWYRKDKLHNDNGPAIIRSNGTKVWYRDGERVDAPSN